MLNVRLLLSYLGYLPLLPLMPLIIAQGRRVRRDTVRLPEAAGARQSISDPRAPALLHLGESTVAGVGAEDFSQAFTAALFRELQPGTRLSNWAAIGRNGVTAAGLLSELQNAEAVPHHTGVIVITLGVNDTTAFTTLSAWRNNLRQLVRHLPQPSQQRPLFFTQVPDMSGFPALPLPLNLFLGLRSRQLDMALQQLCREQQWHHVALTMKVPPQLMADDGYHPNQRGYQAWASSLAATMNRILSR